MSKHLLTWQIPVVFIELCLELIGWCAVWKSKKSGKVSSQFDWLKSSQAVSEWKGRRNWPPIHSETDFLWKVFKWRKRGKRGKRNHNILLWNYFELLNVSLSTRYFFMSIWGTSLDFSSSNTADGAANLKPFIIDRLDFHVFWFFRLDQNYFGTCRAKMSQFHHQRDREYQILLFILIANH